MCKKWIGLLAVFIATIGLSTKSIFAKILYVYHIAPIDLLFYRAIVALPFFIAPLLSIVWSKNYFSKVIRYGGIGALVYLISSISDFVGLVYISASLERAILFTFPIYVLIFFSEEEHFTYKQYILIFTIVVGLALLFNPNITENIDSIVKGSGLVFLSAITWAYFIAFSKKAIKHIGAKQFTASYMFLSTVVLALLAFLFGNSIPYRVEVSNLYIWGYIIMLGFICSVLPSYLLSFGLSKCSSMYAAIVSAVGPIITLALDVVVLSHDVLFNEILGTIIVILSVTGLVKLQK